MVITQSNKKRPKATQWTLQTTEGLVQAMLSKHCDNLAERDLRPAKVKQKVSNGFRTVSGAEIYARIAGFVSTARKNDKNVFNELYTTFEGHNFLTSSIPR